MWLNTAITEGGNKGFYPLHIAANWGSVELTTLLLSYGADVNVLTEQSCTTPLGIAAQQGRYHIAKVLLNQDAELNTCTPSGQTPLLAATRVGHIDTVRLLLTRGALVGNDPRTTSPEQLLANIDRYRHFHVLDMLMVAYPEFGIHYNPPAASPLLPPLMITAVLSGRIENVRFLLDSGEDPNIRDQHGKAALHHAVETEKTTMVSLLLAHNADVNVRATDGSTPLHLAALKGNISIAQMLLEKNANTALLNNRNEAPIQLAAKRQGREMFSLLFKHAYHSFLEICQSDSPEELDRLFGTFDGRLIKKWLDTPFNNHTFPLFLAVGCQASKVTHKLLKYGVNKEVVKKNGYRALHLAAQKGFTNIAIILLQAGAKLNAKTRNRETPLHIASAEGHQEVVTYLLQYAMHRTRSGNASPSDLAKIQPRQNNYAAYPTPMTYTDTDGYIFMAPVSVKPDINSQTTRTTP